MTYFHVTINGGTLLTVRADNAARAADIVSDLVGVPLDLISVARGVQHV